MKRVAMKQWLEEAQEKISADHLDNLTNIFDLEGFDKKIDPQTVEVIRERLNIYLGSWVRPLLEKSIEELK